MKNKLIKIVISRSKFIIIILTHIPINSSRLFFLNGGLSQKLDCLPVKSKEIKELEERRSRMAIKQVEFQAEITESRISL